MLTVLLWIGSICAMQFLFKDKIENVYRTESINAADNETTVCLYPQDTIRQTFVLSGDNLSSVKLAFHYDIDIVQKTSLTIQIFHEETLIVEQPLPLQACPLDTFLTFQTPLADWGGNLTICITNTSAEPDAVFSVLSTTRYYTYKNYTTGYFHNDEPQNGSIICSFDYIVKQDYYQAATSVFYVAIVTIMISGLIFRGCSWLQQRKSR